MGVVKGGLTPGRVSPGDRLVERVGAWLGRRVAVAAVGVGVGILGMRGAV